MYAVPMTRWSSAATSFGSWCSLSRSSSAASSSMILRRVVSRPRACSGSSCPKMPARKSARVAARSAWTRRASDSRLAWMAKATVEASPTARARATEAATATAVRCLRTATRRLSRQEWALARTGSPARNRSRSASMASAPAYRSAWSLARAFMQTASRSPAMRAASSVLPSSRQRLLGGATRVVLMVSPTRRSPPRRRVSRSMGRCPQRSS